MSATLLASESSPQSYLIASYALPEGIVGPILIGCLLNVWVSLMLLLADSYLRVISKKFHHEYGC